MSDTVNPQDVPEGAVGSEASEAPNQTVPAEEVVVVDEEKTDEDDDEVDPEIEEVAQAVIRGEWGPEGQEQRQKLADAGYDHRKVHDAVTRLRNNL